MSQQALEKAPTGVEVAEIVPEHEDGVGHVLIGEKELRDLASLGLYVRDLGAVDLARGTLVVQQQWLKTAVQSTGDAITELGKKTKKTRNDYAAMAQLSHSLARLGAQLTKSQQLLLEIERTPGANKEIVNPSFRVGQPVRPCPAP
jgi:hypothetical protein